MSGAVPKRSLGQAAARGSAWTIAGYGTSQLLRFAANVLFARLLYEQAFALMMLVNGVVQGLQMLSDVGIGPSVVQHPRGDDRRFLGTAYTLQVLRGLLLAALCLALTWPVTAHYAARDPAAADLTRLLPWAAASLAINAFGSTRMLTAGRHLALGRVTLLELASQFAGIGTTIGYALWRADVLALVLGSVAAAVVRVLLSHTALPGPRDHFAWDRTAAPAILRFGGWIFVSTTASFLAMQLDRFVFPAKFSFAESGVYNQAANLAMMVPAVVGSLQLAVVFPLYSRVLGSGEPVGPWVVRVKGAVFAVGGLLVACVVGGGEALIRLFYDDRWQAAGPMVALLSVGAWFQIVESLYGAALLAHGKAKWVALANFAKPVVFLLWFAVGGDQVGVLTAVVAWTVADVAKALVSMVGASRSRVLTPRLDFTATAQALGGAAALWLLGRWLRDGAGLPAWAVLVAVGAAGLVLFAPALRAGLPALRQPQAGQSP